VTAIDAPERSVARLDTLGRSLRGDIGSSGLPVTRSVVWSAIEPAA